MELKKLHMGTMSYGSDSMDEIAHQLATAFGATAEQRRHLCTLSSYFIDFDYQCCNEKAQLSVPSLRLVEDETFPRGLEMLY
jgi:hypothetical protein